MAEFSIIDTYFNRQTVTSNDGNAVDLGVGDDSALLTPPPNQQLVICADTFERVQRVLPYVVHVIFAVLRHILEIFELRHGAKKQLRRGTQRLGGIDRKSVV